MIEPLVKFVNLFKYLAITLRIRNYPFDIFVCQYRDADFITMYLYIFSAKKDWFWIAQVPKNKILFKNTLLSKTKYAIMKNYNFHG